MQEVAGSNPVAPTTTPVNFGRGFLLGRKELNQRPLPGSGCERRARSFRGASPGMSRPPHGDDVPRAGRCVHGRPQAEFGFRKFWPLRFRKFWPQAARMFCGWASPFLSAKPGLGGRAADDAGFKSGPAIFIRGFAPNPRDFCRPSSWPQAARIFCGVRGRWAIDSQRVHKKSPAHAMGERWEVRFRIDKQTGIKRFSLRRVAFNVLRRCPYHRPAASPPSTAGHFRDCRPYRHRPPDPKDRSAARRLPRDSPGRNRRVRRSRSAPPCPW